MAETQTLHDAFLDELRDAYDGEKQLIKALNKMAKSAESDELRTAFQTHLQETQGHAQRLEQVFESLGERARGKHCDGLAGIIEEGKAKMEEDFDGAALDACLIAAAQRAEHYEMAAYGTLVAWAKAMGHQQAVGLLEEILEEERELVGAAAGGRSRGASAPSRSSSARGTTRRPASSSSSSSSRSSGRGATTRRR